jgi:hypothetical protein
MNRRGLLALLGGGAVSAASGMSPAEAAKQLGVPATVLSPGGPDASEFEPVVSDMSRDIWRVRDMMYTRSGAQRARVEQMPVHIRTKKSWSESFKSSCAEREERVMQMVVDRMERDERFAERILDVVFK